MVLGLKLIIHINGGYVGSTSLSAYRYTSPYKRGILSRNPPSTSPRSNSDFVFLQIIAVSEGHEEDRRFRLSNV